MVAQGQGWPCCALDGWRLLRSQSTAGRLREPCRRGAERPPFGHSLPDPRARQRRQRQWHRTCRGIASGSAAHADAR